MSDTIYACAGCGKPTHQEPVVLAHHPGFLWPPCCAACMLADRWRRVPLDAAPASYRAAAPRARGGSRRAALLEQSYQTFVDVRAGAHAPGGAA